MRNYDGSIKPFICGTMHWEFVIVGDPSAVLAGGIIWIDQSSGRIVIRRHRPHSVRRFGKTENSGVDGLPLF